MGVKSLINIKYGHKSQTEKPHPGPHNRKATSSLYLMKMITKLERTPRTTLQNKDATQTHYIQWWQQQTMNKQHHNHLRTNSI